MPLLLISLFIPYIHQVKNKNWRFFLRLAYFILAIIIDIISSVFKDKINVMIVHTLTWILTVISLFPLPFMKISKDNNILLKMLMYVFPFYMLLTRSHEGLFLILFYNYLQLWIKMKWRERKDVDKEQMIKRDNFNLIDIFVYMSLTYASAFSTGNVASLSGFTLSSVFRFISTYKPNLITALLMTKILIPSFFVTFALFEICKLYKYSNFDSLFMINMLSLKIL